MSANFSAKQQRIASSLAAQGSENPCLRCLPKYATDYGKPGFEECRFPDMGLSTSAHTAEGPDGEDLTYYVCYRCEFSGQHCFEVGGARYEKTRAALSQAIVDHKADPTVATAASKVRGLASSLMTKVDEHGKPYAHNFEAHSGANEGGQSGVVHNKRPPRGGKAKLGQDTGIKAMQKRAREDEANEGFEEPPSATKKARVEASTPTKALEGKVKALEARIKALKGEVVDVAGQRDFLMEKANKNTKAAYNKKYKA